MELKVGGLKAFPDGGDPCVHRAPRYAGSTRRIRHRVVEESEKAAAQSRWQPIEDAPELDAQVQQVFRRIADVRHGGGRPFVGVGSDTVAIGMTGERIEERTSTPEPRRSDRADCSRLAAQFLAILSAKVRSDAARRIEARETPMHVQHQLLLDVLDLHPRQGRSNARGMMANATNDPGIDTGVAVCRSHLLLHVVVAEKRAVSGS